LSIAERVALDERYRLRGSAAVGGFADLTGSRECLLIEASFGQEMCMLDASVASLAKARATQADRLVELAGPPFTIDEAVVGRRAVLSVAGEIDMGTADAVRETIESAAGRAFEVWLDLTSTTFMDSSGIHALAVARVRLADANRRLVVVCPDGPVRRVLALTGFDRLFEIQHEVHGP
jgi:anti-sigma B factor antagonist